MTTINHIARDLTVVDGKVFTVCGKDIDESKTGLWEEVEARVNEGKARFCKLCTR